MAGRRRQRPNGRLDVKKSVRPGNLLRPQRFQSLQREQTGAQALKVDIYLAQEFISYLRPQPNLRWTNSVGTLRTPRELLSEPLHPRNRTPGSTSLVQVEI